jgi:hypothetical protein
MLRVGLLLCEMECQPFLYQTSTALDQGKYTYLTNKNVLWTKEIVGEKKSSTKNMNRKNLNGAWCKYWRGFTHTLGWKNNFLV